METRHEITVLYKNVGTNDKPILEMVNPIFGKYYDPEKCCNNGTEKEQ